MSAIFRAEFAGAWLGTVRVGGGLPVIVMSGYIEDTLPVSGLAQPVALLQKPFTPRELRRRIREVLDR